MTAAQLKAEIEARQASLAPLIAELEALERQHRGAESREWIAANGVTAAQVQISNPDARTDQRNPGVRKCSRPKCGGTMLPGKAMAQTYGGAPDFPGGDVVTVSAGGPGVLVDCMKCNVCGHSVTA